jgi:glycosyltransferase involved in cell wall biosynthesis
MKIPCTIGILAYNSEKNIPRALASVADFAEIIVADGGSTDSTLEIARTAGARVISQSNPGHPITDFSKERSLLLAQATQPWFFYLDSDEIMSPELVEHIRTIASDSAHPYGAYRVRYLKTSGDTSKIYRTFREYYQARLVRTDVGAHFERPVHERIIVPTSVRVGQTEAPWYVPLDAEYLSLAVFSKKAWVRTAGEVAVWHPTGITDALLHILWIPLKRIVESLIKMVVVKIRFGTEAIPARYEMLRILYTCMLSVQYLRRLLGKKR